MNLRKYWHWGPTLAIILGTAVGLILYRIFN